MSKFNSKYLETIKKSDEGTKEDDLYKKANETTQDNQIEESKIDTDVIIDDKTYKQNKIIINTYRLYKQGK